MSEKKAIKRAVKAAWDKVKTLRTERGKLYAPNDITASSELLAVLSDELKLLAQQLSALSAMPAEAKEPARIKPQSSKAPRKRRKKAV